MVLLIRNLEKVGVFLWANEYFSKQQEKEKRRPDLKEKKSEQGASIWSPINNRMWAWTSHLYTLIPIHAGVSFQKLSQISLYFKKNYQIM